MPISRTQAAHEIAPPPKGYRITVESLEHPDCVIQFLAPPLCEAAWDRSRSGEALGRTIKASMAMLDEAVKQEKGKADV